MQVAALKSLRELRGRVQRVRESLVDDLQAFLRNDRVSFRRLPASDNIKPDASVATCCSVLMALSLAGKVGDVYRDTTARDLLELMMRSAWDSSELPADNAFTSSILLRTLGMLSEHGVVSSSEALSLNKQALSAYELAQRTLKQLPSDTMFESFRLQSDELAKATLSTDRPQTTIKDVALRLADDLPSNLKVLAYPPTPTLGYWFVTGVEGLGVELDAKQWTSLARWARDDVAKQIALITSKHEARMDPVAMAMAACVAGRLRKLALRVDSPAPPTLVHELPTDEELRTVVRILFEKQGDSGIWPKYFPLFHYPSAGANYCFSFELLEAVLHELIDSKFLLEPAILSGFERAVTWCEINRLEHVHEGTIYRGWNSGGELLTLSQSIPESWATAVVHMFAYELESALNDAIADLVLQKYRAPKPLAPDKRHLERFIDIEVKVNEQVVGVKKILIEQMVEPAHSAAGQRTFRLRKRWSALLFGPPGTSKTSLVKGVASYLGWPYVEINPSEFLKHGLEHLPMQADEIFTDLMDLSKAIVLFDEMDAIVKRREQKDQSEQWRLDPASELLTTSMLPKLAQLHDRAQVMFFFATNHRRDLDSAITRPGRFDVWLCMGPPKWSSKLENLDVILKRFEVPPAITAEAREQLTEYTRGDHKKVAELLDLFTFAEVQSLLEAICRKTDKPVSEIGAALRDFTGERFREEVKEWEASIVLRPSSPPRLEYDADREQSKLQ